MNDKITNSGVRVPTSTWNKMKRAAKRVGRSVNSWIVQAIIEKLDKDAK